MCILFVTIYKHKFVIYKFSYFQSFIKVYIMAIFWKAYFIFKNFKSFIRLKQNSLKSNKKLPIIDFYLISLIITKILNVQHSIEIMNLYN